MAMGTIRRATDEDAERVFAAAERLLRRHAVKLIAGNLSYENPGWLIGLRGQEAYNAVEEIVGARGDDNTLQQMNRTYLRGLWMAAFRRALREPGADTWGWGYIGYHVA